MITSTYTCLRCGGFLYQESTYGVLTCSSCGRHQYPDNFKPNEYTEYEIVKSRVSRGGRTTEEVPVDIPEQWNEELWLSCGHCSRRDKIVTDVIRDRKVAARAQGWRTRVTFGWVCQDCVLGLPRHKKG